MGKIYKIDLSEPFPKALAQGLIERFCNPQDMARCLVLLPSRRACLFFQNALQNLVQLKGQNILLPKIVSLSDIEDGSHNLILNAGLEKNISEPLSSLHQMGLLVHLVMDFQKRAYLKYNPSQAFDLTFDLMSLLDEAQTANVSLDTLDQLAPQVFSHHWQVVLEFLNIIKTFYPQILKDLKKMDPSVFKRENLLNLSKEWLKNPIETPVILAGTTATRFATQKLAQSILKLKQGHIVLPGVDLDSFDKPFVLNPNHPQFALHEFVKSLQEETNNQNGFQIQNWVEQQENSNLNKSVFGSRTRFLHAAMGDCFAQAIHINETDLIDATKDVTLLECNNLSQEACSIAVILRSLLEDKKNKSIVLVTPDRQLARRVKVELKRWNIVPNDSAGTPLSQTPVGQFFNLCGAMLNNPNIGEFLSLLKHPLCAKNGFETKQGYVSRANHLSFSRILEARYFRGRPFFSIDNLSSHMVHDNEPMKNWLDHILTMIKINFKNSNLKFLNEWIDVHYDLARNFFGGDINQLWTQEDGVELRKQIETLQTSGHLFPKLKSPDYISLLKKILAKGAIHPVEGLNHPIMILGTIESRHHNADAIILASMNEETWPKLPDVDPWLNRSMRAQIGLPSLERKIGLSAHDFCVCFSAPQVFITRSKRGNGADTTASRFIVRLETFLKKHNVSLKKQANNWLDLANQLILKPNQNNQSMNDTNFNEGIYACPAQQFRPLEYSLTDIQTYVNEPYVYYARKILKLSPLKPLHTKLEASDRGILLHKIFELVLKEFNPHSRFELNDIYEIASVLFQKHKDDPLVQTFWWGRFENIAKWFHAVLSEQKRAIEKVYTEVEGKMKVFTKAGEATITGKADRIDLLGNGLLRIIDYKTGTPPSAKDLENFRAPQLPLEALIAVNANEFNGFENVHKTGVESIEFWHLKGDAKGGVIEPYKKMENLIDTTQESLLILLEYCLSPDKPYITTGYYQDYLPLTRVEQ